MKRFKQIALAAFVIVMAIVFTAGALATHAGYFGGDVFYPVPTPSARPDNRSRIAAVFISGDIGMRFGMGSTITRDMAAAGTPSVAVNAPAFFNRKRTPAAVSALIVEAATRAMTLGKADRVVLIGHSYGADMIRVGYPGLPPALRAKIAMVGLIVPTDAIHLQISLSEMLDWSEPDLPASAVVHSLNGVPTLCIYGRDEVQSMCTMSPRSDFKVVALPGGHGLDGDSDAVAATLNAAIADITNLSSAEKPPPMSTMPSKAQ
jgi:type IV secretory pathway VirJ component